jgi:hypothetical protein
MVALENVTSNDVPDALRKTEKLRYDRVSFIQQCSRDQARGPSSDERGNQTILNGSQFAHVFTISDLISDLSLFTVILARERNSANLIPRMIIEWKSNKLGIGLTCYSYIHMILYCFLDLFN